LEVDVETLGIVPRGRTYQRVAGRRWELADGTTTTEFGVDRYGLPLDIEGAFRRR
jgi:hypothetical protein